jgi:23S rRNA pseudouridine955/2504/2580 synthase
MSNPPEINVRQFTVATDDEDIRLDRWFKRHLPETTFNLVSRWARTGQLRVDGKRATPGDHVHAGQLIRIPPADPSIKVTAKPVKERPRLSDEDSEFAISMVIHKDSSALVLNKPPGLATQGGTKTTEHVDGFLDALCYEAPARPKLVHRLDKIRRACCYWHDQPRRLRISPRHFHRGRHAKYIGHWSSVYPIYRTV